MSRSCSPAASSTSPPLTRCATLDAAVAETLSAALDGMEHGARLVLDLRGLSFIDSTGLHLLWRSTSARSATDSS